MPSIWGQTLEEHRALVLGRLLDAFAELVRERGIEATTLAAVAERAGIARSAIYNHVRDKHALVMAHTQRLVAESVERMEVALDPALPAPERLARYVRGAFESFAGEPAADLGGILDAEEQRALLAMLRPLRELLVRLVEDGRRDGDFTGGSTDELVGFVQAVINGYRPLLARRQLDPGDAAALCTGLLLYGLAAPSREGGVRCLPAGRKPG